MGVDLGGCPTARIPPVSRCHHSLEAKNLKVLTKDTTWERMMRRFDKHWLSAVDEDYVTSDFYFDIATEICPMQASRVASSVPTLNT